MKTFTKQVLLILLFILSLQVSCRKINSFESEVSGSLQAPLVNKLKAWLKEQSLNATTDQHLFIDSLINYSIWKQGKKIDVSGQKSIIYVPVRNSMIGVGFYYDQSLKLVDSGAIVKIEQISKTKEASEYEAFQSYYYASKKSKITQTNFSGSVSTYSVFNDYKHTLGFMKGILKWEGFVAPKLKSERGGNIQSDSYQEKDTGDGCELWGHFIRWSDGTVTLQYTYLVCSECQTTSININTGAIYLKSNCGGGSTYSDVISAIWNHITNACLHRIVENSVNRYTVPYSKPAFGGTLSENFLSIFGNTSYWNNRNIVFAQNSQIPVRARYKQGAGYVYQSIPDTIYINHELIGPDASQEYVSSIVLHEMAHAVITYTNSSLLTQHQTMAFDYVNSISQTLMNIYPSMSLSSARSLALQGLGTGVYNASFFPNLVSGYGFSTNPASENHWAYKAQRYEAGTEGKRQCE